MAKYLIVIESPGKVQSYRKYLGDDYDIIPSYGHVMDLPKKGSIGVDFKNDFAPTYEIIEGKEDTIKTIVQKAQKVDMVYLMTDPDREGSGIASMIASQFPSTVKYKRASTSSITKDSILEAIRKAGPIDAKMVDSFEVRRILDRIVGWKTSFLVKQATGGSSAGRVQSAALRILAEREKEIRSFKPEEYWPVEAEILTLDKKKVVAAVVIPEKMEINTEVKAKDIEKEIKDYVMKVATYDIKSVSRIPSPPFTTSSLQATASSMFGWDQKHTMSAAQKLYEGGHISYMRTDSTMIVPEQIQVMRSTITSSFGNKYLPTKPMAYKVGKNAQEAHEAIRPTHFEASEVSTGDEAKLYKLIWKRAVSSQMKPEEREQVRATFSNGRKRVVLAASGSRQTFDGYKKCWDYREAGDTFLPAMKVGEVVDVLEVHYEQKFTEPPPRYGVATFNSKLEDLGIARPSTLAAVTATLQARKYIDTKKNTHFVTDLGLRVVDFLIASNFCFVDVTFTKQMEEHLDDILEGKTDKLKVLNEFWGRLKSDIDKSKTASGEANLSPYPCPECVKNGKERFLVKKFSRFGEFYSCQDRKEGCEYKADVGEGGIPKEKVIKPKALPSGFKCPKCSSNLVKRSGKFGDFLGCQSYPKCDVTADLNGVIKEKKPFQKKVWGKKKG